MRKFVLFLISLVLLLSLSGCVYEEIVITDINEYENIWTLPEKWVDENILFPENVNEEQCVIFICKHITYFPLGTGWQVLLEIQYDEIKFRSEVERLENLCKGSPVYGNSDYFDTPAYATVWNDYIYCFEYAVLDESTGRICYVYLEDTEEDEMIIDKKYLPKEYDWQMDHGPQYNVYETYIRERQLLQ